jgi:hypothetical protein
LNDRSTSTAFYTETERKEKKNDNEKLNLDGLREKNERVNTSIKTACLALLPILPFKV